MDESIRIPLVGLVAPAVLGLLAGAGAGFLTIPSTPPTPRSPARAVAVLGLTMALFCGLFGIYGAPNWPPASSSDRLFIIPPAIGLIGLAGIFIAALRGGSAERGMGWLVSILAAAIGAAVGAAIALGPSLWKGSMAGPAGSFWVPLVFALWSALSAWAVGRLAHRTDPHAHAWPRSAAIVLIGLAAAVGATLTGTGSTMLGLTGFIVAAAAIGLFLGLLFTRGSIGPGAISMLCAMLGALLACGVFLSSTPWWTVGALAAVAPAALIADRLVGPRLKPLPGGLLRVLPAAIIAIAAFAPGIWSLIKFQMESSNPQ